MSEKKPPLKDLETRLGYTFRNQGLLKEAMTHSSARARGNADNERLEFLGDRVLGLCIAGLIYERFPEAKEVELALRYNTLVREESCMRVAEALELGPHLTMAPSEARSGGRKKPVILADACEALLGAIYLDGGYEQAKAVILQFFGPLADTGILPARDAKTSLQEFAQGERRGLPVYRECERAGVDHAPSFVVEVSVEGFTPALGQGPSLKKAQQAAAEALLTREKIWLSKRAT